MRSVATPGWQIGCVGYERRLIVTEGVITLVISGLKKKKKCITTEGHYLCMVFLKNPHHKAATFSLWLHDCSNMNSRSQMMQHYSSWIELNCNVWFCCIGLQHIVFPAACNWTGSGFKRESSDRRLLQDECDLLSFITVFARQKDSLWPTSFFLAITRLFPTGWHCKCNPTSIHDCPVLANLLFNPFFKLYF